MNFTHTNNACIVFHVLILKVVAKYFEPSLLVILKKSKHVNMSYIIINS